MRAIVTFVLIAAAVCSPCGAAPAQQAAAEPPRRVVSANLCADQLLLALGDPQSILALSSLASDPTLSPVAEEARRFPAIRGSGEEIVRLSADLALIGAHDTPFTRALLAEKGVPTHALAPWSSLKEGAAQIRALAARLGHAERGEALVAEIEAAAARAKGAAGRPATFLMLHRRGYAPGFHSVTSQIARIAGMVDIAPALGLERGGFVSIEKVVAARPDFLIVADLDARAPDQGKALLLHPALAALYPPSRRLVSPDPATLCAGPATPAAIDALAAEIRAKAR
jgi:iron complex transport system substrate-binding protein